MLEQVKTALGITGTYQDNTIQGYINEVIGFLTEGGVDETVINDNPGLVARGVADLWNYGSGSTGLSPYFWQRASQLAMKTSKATSEIKEYVQRLEAVEDTSADHEGRITTLEKTTEEHEEGINNLNDIITDHEGRITNVEDNKADTEYVDDLVGDVGDYVDDINGESIEGE